MKLKEHLRIIWAITAKDITDAIKNKIVQGVLIGVAFMLLSSQALSLLLGLKDESTAYFWDQGKSTTIKEIVRSRELNFYPRGNLFDLQDSVSQSAEPVIGIVIPLNFDEQIAAGECIHLPAYYAHWPKPDAIAEVEIYFEENLSRFIGADICIDVDDHPVYPPAQGLGYPMMVAFGMVLGVMTVGLILTPYLIVDEKKLPHTRCFINFSCQHHTSVDRKIPGGFVLQSGCLLADLYSQLALDRSVGYHLSGDYPGWFKRGFGWLIDWYAFRHTDQCQYVCRSIVSHFPNANVFMDQLSAETVSISTIFNLNLAFHCHV